jgi:hypothetical protein
MGLVFLYYIFVRHFQTNGQQFELMFHVVPTGTYKFDACWTFNACYNLMKQVFLPLRGQQKPRSQNRHYRRISTHPVQKKTH